MSGSAQARILQIVWYSRTGACRQLAAAAAAAAQQPSLADPASTEPVGAAPPSIDAPMLERETCDCGPSRSTTRKYDAGPASDAPARGFCVRQAVDSPAAGASSVAPPEAGAVDVVTRCDAAGEVGAAQMLEAAGYLFITPENLASMAGEMKAFFDRLYYPLLGRIEGRPAAVIVSAGSDGTGAVRQIERILTGWRVRLAAESVIIRVQASTPQEILAPKVLVEAQLGPARELGAALAAGLALGIF